MRSQCLNVLAERQDLKRRQLNLQTSTMVAPHMERAKTAKEICNIAYNQIDWTEDLDQLSYDTYKDFFPEVEKGMNFAQIQSIVSKKPYIAKIARDKLRNSLN